MKKSIAFALAALFVFTLGCSASTAENVAKDIADQFASIQAADNEYVLRVKSSHHDEYPNVSYGEAFDSFFATPTWKFFESEGGEKVVEFTGDCSFREVNVKARLQFIIATDEKTFDIGALSFNEVPQSNLITFSLLSAAFEEGVAQKDSSTSVTAAPTTDALSNRVIPYGKIPGFSFDPSDFDIPDYLAFATEGKYSSGPATCDVSEENGGIDYLYADEYGEEVYWDYIDTLVGMGFGQSIDEYGDVYLYRDIVNIELMRWSSTKGWCVTVFVYSDPIEGDYDDSSSSETIYLSNDDLTDLNIFISNFVEASFSDYASWYTDNDKIIRFGLMYNWINYRSRFSYATDGGGHSYEGIDEDYITGAIKRFFNRDVTLYSFDEFIYQDGYLYIPAADGDQFSDFAQVYRVETDYTGAFTVYFDVYQPFDVHDGLTQAMYKPLSTWSAALFRSAGSTGRTGVARVRPVVLDGRATYQLESLSVYWRNGE